MSNNCTRADVCLFSEMKEPYETGYLSYQTDIAVIQTLKPLLKNNKIIIVLGTWCGDCKLQVPHFYKILDEAGAKEENIELVCVDRMKKDAHGRTEELNVSRIPSFIFQRPVADGYEELGRIVESPLTTLEEDIMEILSLK